MGTEERQRKRSHKKTTNILLTLKINTGWSNTSFTLTGVIEELSIVPLAAGRPQGSHVGPLGLKYFSAILGNSAEDLRVSLTQLSGRAEIFIAEELSPGHLPTPEIPESYSYRSSVNGAPEVVIPGPHTNRTTFAIAVHGLENTDFSIMASFSQDPVLLQEGMPMQQSVSAGRTEYFVYRITNAEDVTITLTALSGDPDIMASTTQEKPSCYQPEGESNAWNYECANYTWISQSFASDQITILHDLPCEEVGNTRVDAECTADMFGAGKLLYLGVYGYEDSVFTISLTTGGGQTTLVPGQPQHGRTQVGAVCEKRSPSGACDTSSGDYSKAQVSYFKFRVSPDDLAADAHVSVVVEPVCNSTVTPCAAGCPCNPLTVYVTSCAESECSVDQSFPSSLRGHYQLKHVAQGPYSTLFIAHDVLNPNNGFCDPKAHGQVCFYYLTVMHPDADSPPAAFTITASTPADVTVLPTRTHPAPPDGIIFSNLDAVDSASTGNAKNYQMYAEKGSNMLLTLEACTGDVSLAVCDESCQSLYPTETEYK